MLTACGQMNGHKGPIFIKRAVTQFKRNKMTLLKQRAMSELNKNNKGGWLIQYNAILRCTLKAI